MAYRLLQGIDLVLFVDFNTLYIVQPLGIASQEHLQKIPQNSTATNKNGVCFHLTRALLSMATINASRGEWGKMIRLFT